MKEEEKKKIKIEMLKAQSDYSKFEFNQYSIYYLGAITLLLAIFIPIMIYLSNLAFTIFLGIVLLLLITLVYIIINSLTKKTLNTIINLSKQIDLLYNDLLKENKK